MTVIDLILYLNINILGSHVTQHEATYILQWSHFDKAAGMCAETCLESKLTLLRRSGHWGSGYAGHAHTPATQGKGQ